MFKFGIYLTLILFLLGLTRKSQPFLAPKKTISIATLDTIKPLIPMVDIFENDSVVLFKKNVIASYYHSKFEGRKTSSGELYSNKKYTAAHRTFPFGTLLKITNVKNNKSVVVKVNDRGPFSKTKEIDLSQSAFLAITNTLAAGQLIVNIHEVK